MARSKARSGIYITRMYMSSGPVLFVRRCMLALEGRHHSVIGHKILDAGTKPDPVDAAK